tara:strand:+ start:14556 stop:15620 length:1065 start_codon:yes stop_codon:yes gene_type:complete
MSFKFFDPVSDIVTDIASATVTTGLFGPGDSASLGFMTQSLTQGDASASYLAVYQKNPSLDDSAVQFSIAFGHRAGSGSVRQSGATKGFSPTRAIFQQYASLLEDAPSSTADTDIYGGSFTWGTSNAGGNGDTEFTSSFFIAYNRARYKQNLEAKSFQLCLSGSAYNVGGLRLMADTSTKYTANGLIRFPIRSGSEDSPVGTTRAYGWIYPEVGVVVLDPGSINASCSIATPHTDNTDDGVPLKVLKAIQSGSGQMTNAPHTMQQRAEESVKSTFYFVRANNGEFNYSQNPSFSTGSTGGGSLRYPEFISNPSTYITTIGMYNDNNELIAIAKLSKPLEKSFNREALIRVKLDY